MNIFEFLGKPADFRTEKKVFQLVKHFDDVNTKAEQGIYHKKVEFPMFGQVKRDGVFCAVVVRADGKVAIFNRTGKRMTNCENLESYFAGAAELFTLDAGVFLGEMLSEECSLEQLSGVVNPNRTKGLDPEQKLIKHRLHIDFFDGVTICEFISGHSHKGYSARHWNLKQEMEDLATVLPYVNIKDEAALRAFAQKQISAGEEGAVFKQDVEWKAGAKDWHQMKVVRGIHVDLVCIGFEEGTGKYEGLVANLLFRYKNGKTVKAMLGKGWTHDDAREMYLNIHYGESVGMPEHKHVDDPRGKIYHVYGLQPSSKNGLIRLPKVGELRHDKAEPDF
ncbi:ATP-dependent DNA ligase [Vibrio phage D530]